MKKQAEISDKYLPFVSGFIVLAGLYLASLYNFPSRKNQNRKMRN
ncbi:hypothetical protein ACFL35_04545 [Candidatus Riflebacteria bacterium]